MGVKLLPSEIRMYRYQHVEDALDRKKKKAGWIMLGNGLYLQCMSAKLFFFFFESTRIPLWSLRL